MRVASSERLPTILSYVSLLVIALLPFHALLTTWAGSSFGHIDSWRIWKELVIFFILFPAALGLALKTPAFISWLRTSWLARLIVIYLLLNTVVGVWALYTGRVTTEAFIYGFFVDLRFLGFMAITFVLALRSPLISKYWWKILLIPSVIVVIFGCLQLFLPANLLTHFGYGPTTIPAAHTIDQKDNYQRIQSTLRGPNPLGAYLVLVGSGLMAYRFSRGWAKYLFGLVFLAALFFTYSRSAWLGLLFAVAIYFITAHLPWIKKNIKPLVAASVLGLIVLAFVAINLKENDRFENIVFHTNEQSRSPESSNTGRNRALIIATKDVKEHPFGNGPGTAGPASFRNEGKPKIAENYYLQIGQETGWLGIILFSAVIVTIAYLLWNLRADRRALVMLASLIGLTLVNMFSHAWADDTLGLLYFGLLGPVLADGILNKKRK